MIRARFSPKATRATWTRFPTTLPLTILKRRSVSVEPFSTPPIFSHNIIRNLEGASAMPLRVTRKYADSLFQDFTTT